MKSFNSKEEKIIFLQKDENNREISLYKFKDICFADNKIFYPDCIFYSFDERQEYCPIDEKIMSLQNVNDIIEKKLKYEYSKLETTPVFYFTYNTENYYHFIYDTLPYLISYIHLKKSKTNLKLLMSKPNRDKDTFYPFVVEMLRLIGVNSNDILIINDKTLYKEIWISDSYTHGIDSNAPPREEIYYFLQSLTNSLKSNKSYPDKIYISRRTWLHGKTENIGTNYTLKRRLVNEDLLVKHLEDLGYSEIFTENINSLDKVLMFKNASKVIGAIGGGLCNVLFSKPQTKLLTIVSPVFLDVNYRFSHSFKNVNTTYFKDSFHFESGEFKKYMRVKSGNIIGEICEINNDELTILHSPYKIAGWNNETKYEKIIKNKKDCVKLDEGLNSSWQINLDKMKELLLDF